MPGPQQTAVMRLRGVRKTYLMGEVEVPVLHGVDLDIHEGELLTILGESGSGKTTLMNLVGAVDRPDEGAIHFRDEEITTYSEAALTRFRREEVGFVFQLYNLVPTLTARENVLAAAELVADPMEADEALALVGLGDRLEHFPSQLSGGEQQRVALARALAKRPGLLLCDEPTGALDQDTSAVVLGLLQKVNRETGTTLLLITHSSMNAKLAHRVVTLVDGRIEKETVNEHPLDAAQLSTAR